MHVDVSGAEDGLNRLAVELKQPLGRVVKDRSGFFGRYLAESTFPIADGDSSVPVAAGRDTANWSGGGRAAQVVGQAAVRRDIRRVYVPITAVVEEMKAKIGERAAKAFLKLSRTDPAKAMKLLRSAAIRGVSLEMIVWDGGALHRQKRNRRGGVNKGTKPVVVTDVKSLKGYVREKEKLVGFAKSGWINATLGVTRRGLSGVPKYMRQAGARGTGEDRTADTDFPAVHLKNRVSYIQRAFDVNKQYGRVQAAFERSLGMSVEKELEYLAVKRNRATEQKARARFRR